MLLKNERLSKLFYLIPIRLLLDWVFLLKLLIAGRLSNGLAIAKAHFGVLSQWPGTMTKRRQIAYLKRRMRIGKENDTGRFKLLLPLSYYVFRKKTFRQLIR